jgi:peptidoglycan-associated lipoprotein
MKTQSLKLGLFAAVLSMVIAGCSSTSTSSGTETGSTTLPGDGVATGTVDNAGVGGSLSGDDLSSIADTVFYFDFDKAILKPESRAALRLHAQNLKANPRAIRLEGHADERGTREYNMALGERRANAVREFLMLEGVNGASLEVISYGEESPAAQGSDEASYALNRRVEMK